MNSIPYLRYILLAIVVLVGFSFVRQSPPTEATQLFNKFEFNPEDRFTPTSFVWLGLTVGLVAVSWMLV